MPLEIHTSPDAPPLERLLLDRITALRKADAWAPILVVAPTGRILASLRRRILERGATLWAVHLLHHRALAERIVESAGEQPLRVLRGRQQKAILSGLLARIPPGERNPVEKAAAASGGALSAVLACFRDLREALVPAGSLAGVAGAEPLLRLYGGWRGELARLEEAGLGDAVSLAMQAAGCAGDAPLVTRAAAVLHYGAYDLTGANRALIERIAARAPVTLLVPGVDAGPAYAHSRATLASWAGDEAVNAAIAKAASEPRGPVDGAFVSRLRSLYDEMSDPPEPLPAGEDSVLESFTAPGAEAELEAAGLRALAFIGRSPGRGGPIAPHEIAIVSRTLEPYASLLEPVLGRDLRLAFTTSAKVPLRRDPRARALRDLLRTLLEDFPAGALFDFLRSGEAVLDVPGNPEFRPRPDRWAILARRAGIAGGRERWTEDLPAWAESRLAEAQRARSEGDPDGESGGDADEGESASRRPSVEGAMRDVEEARACAGAVESLAADAARWLRCTTWREHASWLRDAIARRLKPPADRAHAATRAALDAAVASLEENAFLERDRTGRVSRDEAVRPLLQAIESEMLPMTPALAPGISVLDAMQLRGLSFRVVIWIGLNSGQQPLRPRADPCLSDDARRALRAATGKPVPVRAEAAAEERLLVAILLGTARERLVLAWQHADEAGRGRAPSIVLRELARALRGRADIEAMTEGVRALPMHPQLRAENEARDGVRLLTPRQAAVAAAARQGDPATALDAIRTRASAGEAHQLPAREAISHARALGEFSPTGGGLPLDGLIGESVLPFDPVWSPSRLEDLGRCPLQWFFRHGLRVDSPDAFEEEWLLDPREAGAAAHRVLSRAMGELLEPGGFPPGFGTGGARAFSPGRLAAIFDEEAQPLARRAGRRYPRLWTALRARWIDSLEATLDEEVRWLRDTGARVEGRELEITGTIGTPAIPFRGRLDRLDVDGAGRLTVVDYKSSTSLEKLLDPTAALRGGKLQLHVYRQLVAGRSLGAPRGRVVPIGAKAREAARKAGKKLTWPAPGKEASAAVFDPEFQQTVGELVGLAGRGAFPMRSDDHCAWCEFIDACRRSHPPSEARVAESPAFAAYFRLEEKKISTVGKVPDGDGS